MKLNLSSNCLPVGTCVSDSRFYLIFILLNKILLCLLSVFQEIFLIVCKSSMRPCLVSE